MVDKRLRHSTPTPKRSLHEVFREGVSDATGKEVPKTSEEKMYEEIQKKREEWVRDELWEEQMQKERAKSSSLNDSSVDGVSNPTGGAVPKTAEEKMNEEIQQMREEWEREDIKKEDVKKTKKRYLNPWSPTGYTEEWH